MKQVNKRFTRGFEKVAFDGNYISDSGNFTVHGNRSLGPDHDLHKALEHSLKDPKLEVTLLTGPTLQRVKDPNAIRKHLSGVRKKHKTGGAFDRGDHWEVAAKKEHFGTLEEASSHVYGSLYKHKIKGHKKTAAPGWYYEMSKNLNPKSLANHSTQTLKNLKLLKGLPK